MRSLLTSGLVLLLGGCAFLADPLNDVAEAAFDIPLFGKSGEPARFSKNAVQPLEVRMEVEPGKPARLPEVDTSRWGAVLRFDAMARRAGLPRALRIEIRDLDLADDMEVSARVSSKDPENRVLGASGLTAGPEHPAACTFRLGPTSEGANLAGHLDACVTAWVDMHGAPVQPQVEITVAQPGGGQGLAEPGSFQASWNMVLHAEDETDVDCKVASVSDTIKADAEYLRFEGLQLAGAGASTEDVTLEVYADFYHPVAGRVASGELRQPIAGGELYWISRKIELDADVTAGFTEAGNVDPTLSPGGAGFVVAAVDALVADGWGVACWRISGVAPRDGFVALTISGTGKYVLGGE